MKKIQLYLFAFVITGFIAACGNTKKNIDAPKNTISTVVDETTFASAKGIDSSTETPIYQPSRTIYTDLIHTELKLIPVWEKSEMLGVATITAKPHFYPSDSLILDAKGMQINTITMNGKNVDYSWKEDVLKIKLDKTYTRTESYKVKIDYIAKPEELKKGGSAAIQDDKGLYFINPTNEPGGYMPQIWTQGETESNSVWFPTIDSPNIKSTADIYLTVDKKYKTLSNGKLVASTENKDGTRTDHYQQSKPISMYLYMIAVGEFEIVHDSYTKADGTKMAVNYYVEPEWKHQAQAIFGNTPEMLKFFKDKLGIDYVWDEFHQIIVREYVSGAMENVGAVVFGEFMYRDSADLADEKVKSDAIIAHELFHHWFGDLVTAESWANLTVNESFANYSEYLWNEYKYGLDVAQYVMEDTKQGYYNVYPTHDLVWFDHKHRDDVFDGVTYNKGGAILNQLRGYLGDDAFFASLNLYLTRHQYGTAEAHNLRMAFEDVSGEDLNWYFNDWYYGKGHPSVEITMKKESGNFTLNFDQIQTKDFGIFTIPMKISYTDQNGEHTKTFKITQKNQDFSFQLAGDLKTIIIDPDKTLLGKYNFNHSDKDLWMNQLDVAKNYNTKKEAIEHLFSILEDNKDIKEFTSKVLKDPFYGTQLATLNQINERLIGYQRYQNIENGTFVNSIVDVAKIKDLAQNGSFHEVRSTSIEIYLASLQTNEKKTAFLRNLMKTETSNNVLATILKELLAANEGNAENIIQEFATKYPSNKMDFALADYYLSNGVQGKMDFYKNLYETSTLRNKGDALMYLGYYSFSSGLGEMADFARLIDTVYESTYSYKKYIAKMMIQAKEEISHYAKEMEESAKKEKSDADIFIFIGEMKKLEFIYREVIDKHNMSNE